MDPIDPILFERALQLLVSETETLRVRITEKTGEPHQIVTSAPAWSLPIIDVSGEIDPRRAAETWMKSDLGQPIDLSREPLFAFALFKASPDRFFWYARYHHVIMDACGMWLVARRLAQLYSLLSTDQSTNLDSPGSLRALLEVDAAYRRSERLTQDQKYWRQYLAGRPTFSKLAACTSPASNGFLRQTAYLPLSTLKSSPLASKGNGDKFIPHFSQCDWGFSSSAYRRSQMCSSACQWQRATALHAAFPEWSQTYCRCNSGSSRQYPVRDRGSGRLRNSPEPAASTLSACRFAKGLWCNI